MDRNALVAAMRAAAAEKPVAVDLPKWGRVYVRQITVAEMDQQAKETEAKDDKNRMARGACRVLCDESGKLLFDPASEEDVKLLASQPWSILRKALSASDPEAGKA